MSSKWGTYGFGTGQFYRPESVAVDSSGYVYIADTSNHRIQKFRPVTLASIPKAVVVAAGGPFPGNNLWDATESCANFAYRALNSQGYTKDVIRYLSSDTQVDLDNNDVADDVDGDCTKANLQLALTTWASAPVNSLPVEDVVVYLVDHGGVDAFRLNDTETLSSPELSSWLDTLQTQITGKLIVVYDACESGSFIADLAAPSGYEDKRIVITSTSPGESAYFVTRGTVSFSNYFWTQIFNGVSVKDAFDIANQALSQTFGYQHPLLDDTGDGAGNTPGDGDLASGTFIGNGTRQYWEGPEIGAISGDQVINGTSTAALSADPVTDSDGVARVWGVIRPPGFDQSSSDNPIAGLPTVELFPTTGDQFEGTYQYFTTPGTYNILIYAMDRVGNVSAPKLTTVSVGNPLKRKAVIVAGGSGSDVLWPSYEETVRSAYEALRYQGYDDSDITFMSPVTIGGVDYGPSLTNLQNALSTSFNANTQDVTLFLAGPSNTTGFAITPTETLTAVQLDTWLDTLQGSLPGKVTVIYDAGQSGSFLGSLLPPSGNRIVLASTNATQSANFLKTGSISFSKFFWGRVLNGANVYEAWSYARAAMRFAGVGPDGPARRQWRRPVQLDHGRRGVPEVLHRDRHPVGGRRPDHQNHCGPAELDRDQYGDDLGGERNHHEHPRPGVCGDCFTERRTGDGRVERNESRTLRNDRWRLWNVWNLRRGRIRDGHQWEHFRAQGDDRNASGRRRPVRGR